MMPSNSSPAGDGSGDRDEAHADFLQSGTGWKVSAVAVSAACVVAAFATHQALQSREIFHLEAGFSKKTHPHFSKLLLYCTQGDSRDYRVCSVRAIISSWMMLSSSTQSAL